MPALPSARRLDLGAVTLEVHEAGQGTPVVLCHGFPELAYSWRHQIQALSAAGFRAIAPNQRGYGESDAPADVGAYDIEQLTGDLVALLDHLGLERAFFAGHDWGGFVVWAMPLLHPERCAGIIGVNTPYIPFPDTTTLSRLFPDPEKLYILWFQQQGVAESVLDREPRLVFERLMRRGAPASTASPFLARGDANPFRGLEDVPLSGDALLDAEDLEVYTRAFAKSGFRGGINWYRNIDRNRTRHPEVGTAPLSLPCLMITAEWDLALSPGMAADMPSRCSDLETHMINACGHWTQQEKPDELSALMIDWLRRRDR